MKRREHREKKDRAIWVQNEAEAKRVSLAIDASIKAERHARRKKRIVRLLLLGQSESGEPRYRFTPLVLMRVCVQGNLRLYDVRLLCLFL